ncbi:MAG: sterol desaturase family protein [Proteobacteria bacterium]|nr:sterol desaturase family protein [Pseudomonadota bacterium]
MSHFSRFLIDDAYSTQVFLFALFTVSIWTVERAATGETTFAKLKHTSVNGLFLFFVVPVQLLMMVLCMACAKWVTEHHWGLVYLLATAENPWIKYGAMFFALDFLDYVYHTAAHRIPVLWRFHSVHHMDQVVDVSTTFREHPGETFVRIVFLMLWVLLCGACGPVLILRQTVQTFANVLAHTSLQLPAGPARVLGWFFITPNLHRAHHHFQRPATNCNFGDVFSIWDRLFRTQLRLPHHQIRVGLDTHLDGTLDAALLRILVRGRVIARALLRLQSLRA